MKRREFITLAGGAVAWPVVGRAQQSAMPVIGFLSAAGSPSASTFRSFSNGLNALGFFEGRNLAIVSRSTERYDELPALVNEMIKIPVAVIYAFGSANSARAAKAATTVIPIVFANGGDPVKLGLVSSMNRPSGNVTGVTFFSADLAAKRLELLSRLLPTGSLIAFLINPANDRAGADINDVKTAARGIGLEVMVVNVSTVAGIEAAFVSIAEHKAKAVLVGGDPFLGGKSNQLTVLAARYQLITSYANRSGVDAGGLMSYSDDRAETYRQAGIYVGRILKGERPADLPVLQPTKFEFVINLKTAKALGLEIPPTLLAIADEVIE